ncbi:hypothetical protein C0J52_05652, partial [Blattella germanica]
WNATKLLKFKPYKIGRVHKRFETDYKQRLRFCNWYLQSMNDERLDPQMLFCTDEASCSFFNETAFNLHGHLITHDNRYWFSKNPHIIVEPQNYEEKLNSWCAISM